MRVTALGHAGLKVETGRATLLLDPWFSPEGAFQASWFQFPENDHLLGTDIFRPSAILISHEHLDHVDPWFLACVPPEVPAVVPRYPSPALRHKIEAGGPREIVEAAQWERVAIADGTSAFFVSEPPMNHDSAIVIEGDGRTLLDLNDARLFPVQFREIREKVGGDIDLFTFQGAGASWYPMCYRYPEGHMRKVSRQKRMAKLAYCFRSMRVLDPVMGAPFAGPPAFLDESLFRHNLEMDDGIFPHQQQVADWLRERRQADNVVLLPGDAWDVDHRSKEADARWEGFSLDHDRLAYLEGYAARRASEIDAVLARHPQPESSLWESFREYFERLMEMSPYFNDRINMRVGFEIEGPGGGDWSVDFRPGTQGVYDDLGACGYTYRFASRWLPPLLTGQVPWEDFFLSLRFEARREPDVYNDHLLGLLKFADRDALREVESFETTLASDERIEVHSEGRTYSVSRYCPHAGNDLLNTGEVLPGNVLRCLAHHYEFDLASGVPLNGNCPSLEVEPVDEEGREDLHGRAAREHR